MKTITDAKKLEIINKKVEQLANLYDSERRGMIPATNDILVLMKFTLSLERQIRQLRADFVQSRIPVSTETSEAKKQ